MDRTANQPTAAEDGDSSLARQASWNLIDPAHATYVLGDHAPDWYALDDASCAILVKRNALRSVYRVQVGDQTYYAKTYDQTGWKARLSQWLRGDPARREVRAAQYAREHHVPAATFCALSRGQDSATRRQSLSISPVLENVGTLAEVFDDDAREPHIVDHHRRQSLIDACAKLVATAHDAAFLHPDNHAGNIVVQEGDGPIRCAYVDVYGARCGVAVTLTDAADNLAPLVHWMSRRCSLTQMLRGLMTYVRQRELFNSRDARKRWIRSVAHRTRAHARRLYGKRGRRIGRSCAYFERRELTGGWRAVATLRLRDSARALGNRLPADDIAAVRAELETRIRDDFAVARGPVLVDRSDTERFFIRRMLDGWLWRRSNPALRRYKSSLAAMHRDLDCVVGWSYLEQRDGSRISQVAWIRLTPPNRAPVRQWLASELSASHRRIVLDRLGKLLADTLDRGLVPRNMSSLPLAVLDDGGGCAPRIIWDGIEATAVGATASRSARRFALAQCIRVASDLSMHDVARALRSYCRRSRCGDWKDAWRELAVEGGDA